MPTEAFAAVSAVTGVVSILKGTVKPARKSFKDGRKFVHDTAELLHSGAGKAIPDPTYEGLVKLSKQLATETILLERDTKTFASSIGHYQAARKYKTQAEILFYRVKALSDTFLQQEELNARRRARELQEVPQLGMNLETLAEEVDGLDLSTVTIGSWAHQDSPFAP